MAIPLFVVSTGLPLIGAVKSMAEATFTTASLSSFNRFKMRLLIGFLHIVQPMARLYGRSCYGLTPWRRGKASYYVFPRPRKYTIWSESWRASSKWVQSIKAAIIKQGAIVKQGGDFDHWDLEIRGGLWGAVRSQMAIEEHGGGKQLVRFRTWPIIYPMGLALIVLFAFLSLLAAVDQAWLVVTLLGTVTVGLVVHVFENCGTATAACRQVMRTQEKLKDDDVDIEKDLVSRKKMREGIILVNFDRRQNSDSYYSGPERRNGIERRNGFANDSSQPGRRL